MRLLNNLPEDKGRGVLIGVFLTSLLWFTSVSASGQMLGTGLFVGALLVHGYIFGYIITKRNEAQTIWQLLVKYCEDLFKALALYIMLISIMSALSIVAQSGFEALKLSPSTFFVIIAALPSLLLFLLLKMLGVSHKTVVLVSAVVFSVAWTVLLTATFLGVLFALSWLWIMSMATGISLVGLTAFSIMYYIRFVRSI